MRQRKGFRSDNHETRQFKGREFKLKLTTNYKNKAKNEARKYSKRGFHTRVIEINPGVFAVYRRLKEPHI